MKDPITLFISGGDSNARQIIHYFRENERVKVAGVLSNKPNSEMERFCAQHHIPFFEVLGGNFSEYLAICQRLDTKWVILAGFLKKIPKELILAFPNRIINIHPSLLPNYGGAGMYGKHVHKAVSEAKELFSGMSIHLVNEEFDKGKILFQHAIKLPFNATPQEVEQKVRSLEMIHFAKDLDVYISSFK